MIKVKEDNKKILIFSSVTDFSDSLGYCEYRIPIFLRGIKAPPSIATLQGSVAHNSEKEYEEKHFEFEEITSEQLSNIEEDVEFPREEIFTRLLIPFEFDSKKVIVSLFGRTDKIFRSHKTLVIQDDKFPTNLSKYDKRFEPYPDQLLQTLIYLNSLYSHTGNSNPDEWFEIPHKQKQWIIQIKDKQTNSPYKIFKGMQNSELLKLLHYNIERFAKLVLFIESFEHHNSASKCNACRYVNECDQVIT